MTAERARTVELPALFMSRHVPVCVLRLEALDFDQDVAGLAPEPSPSDAVFEERAVQLDLWVIEFEDDAVVGEEPPVHVGAIGRDGGEVSSRPPFGVMTTQTEGSILSLATSN